MDCEGKFSLWVKSEVFQCGVLHASPHPKHHKKNLRKVLSYLKLKSTKAQFPCVKYSDWNHVCCRKLQVEKSYSSTMFALFETLMRSTEHETEKSATIPHAEDKSPSVDPSFNVCSLVLFLMIQQINSISVGSSSIDSSEKWPSNENLNSSSSTCNVKSADDGNRLSFILDHLEEFVDVIQGGGFDCVTADAVESLGFLIEGHIDECFQSVVPLDRILCRRSAKLSAGFDPVSGTYRYRAFMDWLRGCLVSDPYGLSALKKSYCILSWIKNPTTGNPENRPRRGRVVTNAHKAVRNRKLIVLSKISNATLARSSKTLDKSCVTLDRCFQSYIYLLSALRMASVRNCQRSQFVLGTTKISVSVDDCKNCTFIVSCRHIVVSNCSDCTFYLLTPSSPVLVGNKNAGIRFAPYNTSYPQLAEHVSRAGMSLESNLWDQPVHIAANGKIGTSKVWQLMDPSEFYFCEIPFEMHENPADPKMVVPVPALYKAVLMERENHIGAWNKLVADAGLTEEQNSELQARIDHNFQEWLKTSGGLDTELESLVQ